MMVESWVLVIQLRYLLSVSEIIQLNHDSPCRNRIRSSDENLSNSHPRLMSNPGRSSMLKYITFDTG